MLFYIFTCNLPKIVKGTLIIMGSQNKIKKGCKYGKLLIISVNSSNFESGQHEMGKVASMIIVKCRN